MTPENKTLIPRLIKFLENIQCADYPGEEERGALIAMIASSGTTLNPDANLTGGTTLNEGAQGIEERANEYADGRYGAGTATTNLWNDAKIGFVAGAKSQHIVSTLAERNRVVKIVEDFRKNVAIIKANKVESFNDADRLTYGIQLLSALLTQITNGQTVEGNDRWVDVKERLPEPFVRVWIYTTNDYQRIANLTSSGRWNTDQPDMLSAKQVTHWMEYTEFSPPTK